MKRYFTMLLALSLSAVSGCVTVSPTDQDARSAAVDWLAIVDAGQYMKAYADRPPRILAGANKEEFLHFMQGRRAPLGKAKSRAFYRVMTTKKLAGAPDGNYEIIYFKSIFEHKTEAIERVTMTGETGRWQVSGYGFR